MSERERDASSPVASELHSLPFREFVTRFRDRIIHALYPIGSIAFVPILTPPIVGAAVARKRGKGENESQQHFCRSSRSAAIANVQHSSLSRFAELARRNFIFCRFLLRWLANINIKCRPLREAILTESSLHFSKRKNLE